jgi:hypothetical protein
MRLHYREYQTLFFFWEGGVLDRYEKKLPFKPSVVESWRKTLLTDYDCYLTSDAILVPSMKACFIVG